MRLSRLLLVCSLAWAAGLIGCSDSNVSGAEPCHNRNGGCDSHATCANNHGAALCTCGPGYTGDGKTCVDENECADGTAKCDPHAICTNTDGSYKCACAAGWAGDGSTCMHTDECATDNGGCDPNAACMLTASSHTCVCKPGFQGDGTTCTDVDECAHGNGGCDKNATCTNTPGSFMCTCKDGFSGDGHSCTDVNECATNNGGCDANATCTNTPGSFTCTCAMGFEGDGKKCNDIDECQAGTAFCSPHATCTNTIGSFVCTCASGLYSPDGAGHTCADVDECAAEALPGVCTNGTCTSKGVTWAECDQHASCSNSYGGYTCTCDTAHGFIGTGTSCHLINECIDTPGACDPNANCTKNSPTPGDFTCSCKPGFVGNGLPGTCMDIDECATHTAKCDVNAVCTNTQGSYDCTCNAGYQGDGFTCSDVDECATGTAHCSPYGLCTNTIGSFQCRCEPGYTGDGKKLCIASALVASVGDTHACAINRDGTLWCWGRNQYGELGNGTTKDSSLISQEGSHLSTWIQVAAGSTHTCAIDDSHDANSGRLWCWGDNTNNALGPIPSPSVSNTVAPALVGTDNTWQAVSAGNLHACAIKTDGTLWCWGDNTYGLLGQGMTSAMSDSTLHQVVPMNPANTWTLVVAGTGHDCGIQSDNTLWCWGRNDHGELGGGTPGMIAPAPQQVGTAATWDRVSVGDFHTCGIHTDGTLQCWGLNNYGQLGFSTGGSDQPTPKSVDTENIWSSAWAGGNHTCAVKTDNTLWCWGSNVSGEVGDNSGFTGEPLPVQIGATSQWSYTMTKGGHSCGAQTDGTFWCWGADGTSQTNQPVPVQVAGIQH